MLWSLWKATNVSTQWAAASPTGCDRKGTGTKNLLVTEEHRGILSVAVKENTHVTGAALTMSHVIGTGGLEASYPQAAGPGTGRIEKAVGILKIQIITASPWWKKKTNPELLYSRKWSYTLIDICSSASQVTPATKRRAFSTRTTVVRWNNIFWSNLRLVPLVLFQI